MRQRLGQSEPRAKKRGRSERDSCTKQHIGQPQARSSGASLMQAARSPNGSKIQASLVNRMASAKRMPTRKPWADVEASGKRARYTNSLTRTRSLPSCVVPQAHCSHTGQRSFGAGAASGRSGSNSTSERLQTSCVQDGAPGRRQRQEDGRDAEQVTEEQQSQGARSRHPAKHTRSRSIQAAVLKR